MISVGLVRPIKIGRRQCGFLEGRISALIVHWLRNILKYMAYKDRMAFAKDFKTIRNAPNEERERVNRDWIIEKRSEKYSNAMKR